ncbi:N-acetylgalactosamine kinase [Musca domestica]|uniref:N-acetylgalactosamine kinase n=1 Tax=Musca domestica TaxID=7370 RepID=A0A1I8MLS2_MUSDO|nr:N-acetylgalactosamine kinase [Musca domestica]XP_011293925.1 N-acetylgalactosamine kinase [Musca domestica]XP_011293926.1 N-acetylgalactosamine kinase [Musca domestica]XP_019893559.1 N-acetylgalactosamine kinase [Musca domestica]XP_058980421.1 N-acetylgalactosamine kinase [Musca domestica]
MADSTSDIYVSTTEILENHGIYRRLHELQTFYRNEYGSEPKVYVRVPGRVNLIGEHVDYCGYPVLPMAIDQCILLAVGYTEANTQLELRNMEKEKYEDFSTDLSKLQIIHKASSPPPWYNYYLCGVKGILETLTDNEIRYGMTVAISGNIPPASGVSSSSALVSSAVLATGYVHHATLNRKTLASISAACERYIGTQGGGMDQAIAYLAKEGCAQFIEFYPSLNATPLRLPEGACFVVANSLAEMNKAATSDFNERVVECRLGCRLIALNKNFNNWKDMQVFAKLQAALACDLAQLERYALEFVSQDIYKRSELCEVFGVTNEEFERDFLTENTRNMQQFKLKQRTLHVIQESLRVLEFHEICEKYSSNSLHSNGMHVNGNGDMSFESTVSRLSQLMRQSHESLKTLYECSHPNLDKLVEISHQLGIGARLTGAGWGGCIVALCDSVESSNSYIEALKDKYYSKLSTEKLQFDNFDNVVFATCPRNGAELLTLQSNDE